MLTEKSLLMYVDSIVYAAADRGSEVTFLLNACTTSTNRINIRFFKPKHIIQSKRLEKVNLKPKVNCATLLL